MDEKRDSVASEAFGLQELEPSPVDETPFDNESSYFPPSSSSDRPPPILSRSTNLGLGSHGPVFYLTRLQKYSSYAFTLFTAAHLTNTAIIPLFTRSVHRADNYLLLTRPYYQSFPLEAIVVAAPLTIHILSGLTLRLYRRREIAKRYGAETHSQRRRIPWPKLSGTSALGLALVPLVGAHAFVNRILTLWQEGGNANIGLEYVAHGFARHPLASFAVYVPLLGVMSWHVVWGWARWLGWSPAQVTQGGYDGQISRKRRWYAVNAISAGLAVLWLAGGLGVVGRGGPSQGWLAKEYDGLFSRIPIFGPWL
ncbi:hypothetical protein NA57DRAFT_58194 [Rhizodiscina lignyota]|uniref:Mitochondrial adapter protein MCP1 transmembrane domain-containing protein n=1 Tax=Rhizodiscina lignyota TaxID=1504668 RepID=A0A9P4IFN6_9PEZI|nr:hypothetical protein NA57DRAFT_58194 [Rhizodiscina lignyota]